MLSWLKKIADMQVRGDDVQEVIDKNDPARLLTLLAYGVSPDKGEKNKYAHIHWAVVRSAYACGALLLEHGANPNEAVTGKERDTALHTAVRAEKTSFIELLLFYGADATVEDERGFTPLQLARHRKIDAWVKATTAKVQQLKQAQEEAEQHLASDNYAIALDKLKLCAAILEEQSEIERGKPKDKDSGYLVGHYLKMALPYYEKMLVCYAELAARSGLSEQQQIEYEALLRRMPSIGAAAGLTEKAKSFVDKATKYFTYQTASQAGAKTASATVTTGTAHGFFAEPAQAGKLVHRHTSQQDSTETEQTPLLSR